MPASGITTKRNISSNRASRLFLLPLELRYRIYDYLFNDSLPPTAVLSLSSTPAESTDIPGLFERTTSFTAKVVHPGTGILHVCKRCRDEALPIFLRRSSLCIKDHFSCDRLLVRRKFILETTTSPSANGSATKSAQSSNILALDCKDLENLVILIPYRPVPAALLRSLRKLVDIFPSLRALILRVVYVSLMAERPDEDLYITLATPAGPSTHLVPDYHQDSSTFYHRGSYKNLNTLERITHWLTREVYRVSRRPIGVAGALSAHRVFGTPGGWRDDESLQELLKKLMIHLATRHDDSIDRSSGNDNNDENGETVTSQPNKSLDTSTGSMTKVLLEGEMRLVLYSERTVNDFIADADIVDMFVFNVDPNIDGICSTVSQDPVISSSSSSSSSCIVEAVSDNDNKNEKDLSGHVDTSTQESNVQRNTRLRNIRMVTASSAERRQRLQQILPDERLQTEAAEIGTTRSSLRSTSTMEPLTTRGLQPDNRHAATGGVTRRVPPPSSLLVVADSGTGSEQEEEEQDNIPWDEYLQ